MKEKEKEIKKCPPHRYKRKNLTKTKDKPKYLVYACIECPHFVRKDLVVNKEARCYNCNTLFIVGKKQAIKQSKLRCEDCVKRKPETVKSKRVMDDLLDDLIDDILR